MKKEQLLAIIKSAPKHWYAILLTIVCVLIATEVLDTWAGFAAPFLSGLGLIIKKMIKS